MKTVLVTRPADQATDFTRELARLGIDSICVGVTTISPLTDWTAVDAALSDIESYDALIFTSANGVRFFIERMARTGRNCDEMPAAFGLGSKTKSVMEDCGLTVINTDDALNANGLAGEICTFMSSAGFDGIEGMRFLFPCGDKARTELPAALRAHGAFVDAVVVYHNVPSPPDHVRHALDQIAAGAIDCIAFFAPSQVQAFFHFIPALPPAIRTAAIGETTAAALRDAGVVADVVAPSPESERFAAAIAALLAA